MELRVNTHLSLLLVIIGILSTLMAVDAAATGCDLFQGNWVLDSSYPLYNESTCPFLEKEFNCINNGRPDRLYLKYRWLPRGCRLSRFDGRYFLEKLRGKTIMFVGDSLSRNQWLSMLCMIHSSVPTTNYAVNISVIKDMTTYTFKDYGLKVTYHHNLYLVDIVKRRFGRVLNLNTVTAGKLWLDVDYLIFNTWHWWNRRGASQPFDYIQDGTRIYKDMDRLVAFGKAIVTWGQWVDANVVQNKTKVFFQGISPSHYNGTDWGNPKAKSCYGQKIPVLTSVYPGAALPAVAALKKSLKTIKKPVTLLDITNLSLLRKDGHPSTYGFGATDCSHWCLAGVPDTWNILLYNLMF
ncbi:putative PMR5 domain, PC-Esterase [Helianthus annuus]|nr:putative PMR5 domain, PC-Esterase [Helianthus annuus]